MALLLKWLISRLVKRMIMKKLLKQGLSKVLNSKLGKGYLTNAAAIGSVVLPVLQLLGYDVAPADVDAVISGLMALAVIVGKMRAVHQVKNP